jgi:hypothetical protein
LLAFSIVLFFIIVIRPFMQWITDSFQEAVGMDERYRFVLSKM